MSSAIKTWNSTAPILNEFRELFFKQQYFNVPSLTNCTYMYFLINLLLCSFFNKILLINETTFFNQRAYENLIAVIIGLYFANE